MANVSNVPYPGHEHSSPGFGGVLIHQNAIESGADQTFLRGLETILTAAGDSTLLRAFHGLETWDPQYDGSEVSSKARVNVLDLAQTDHAGYMSAVAL